MKKKTLALQTAKGAKEYDLKELDFTNIMCDLEDNGIDVIGFMEQDDGRKMFSFVRAIIGVLTDTHDLREAGRMLSEHLSNGGKLDDILDAFRGLMVEAGFGGAEGTESE